MIRIRSLREGFRRGGVAHSTTPTDHPDTQFTAAELEQLLFEPMLAVEVLPNDTDKLTVQEARQAIADFLDDADKSYDAGETGNAGESGDIGETGNAGESGDTGETSNAGESGDAGETGNADKSGNAGEPGNAGEADSSTKTDKPTKKPGK
jgi:hypothetical protein